MRNNSSMALPLLAVLALAGAGLYVAASGGDALHSGALDGAPNVPSSAQPAPGLLPEASGVSPEKDLNKPRAAAVQAAKQPVLGSARVSVASEETGGDLVVLVQDTAGQPLANLWIWISSTPDDRDALRSEALHAASDAKGRIVFEGVRASLNPDMDWYLVHDVAFETLPRTQITLAALELPEVLTVQPDSGAIEVCVVEYDGSPSVHVQGLALQLIAEEEERDATLAFERQEFEGTLRVNQCVFPYVALSRRWGVRAERGNGFDTIASAEGPRTVAARTKIVARFGSDRPVIVLRAVDEGGMPLANQALALRTTTIFGSAESQDVVTDERGGFAAHFGLEGAGILGVKLTANYTGEDGREFVGTLDQLGDLENGENHPGDLILHAAVEIVAGRVQSSAGKALQGVLVRAGQSPNFQAGNWGGDDFIETRSDSEGEFSVRGHGDWEEFKLWAFGLEGPWGAKFSTLPEGLVDARSSVLDVRRGDRNVVLVLGNLVKPWVDVLLPAGARAERIELELIPKGRSEDVKSVAQTTISEGSAHVTYTFEPLEPGNYELRCTLRGEETPVLELPNQWVEGNGLLTKLDLRDRVFVHTIHLQGAEAQSLEGSYCFRAADSQEDWICENFGGDRLQVTTSMERIDLRVFPGAHRGDEWLGLKGEATLVLSAPYRIRLLLRTTGKMPTHPYLFSVRPHFGDQDVGTIVGAQSFTDSQREMLFDVPMAGKHSVHWHYEQRGDSWAIGGGVLYGREVEIDVQNVAGEQVFELQLDGEALTQLADNPPWD